MKIAVVLCTLLVVADAAPHAAVPLDATLRDTAGRPVTLASRRGAPVVLFYEDRASTGTNGHVKAALARQAGALATRDAVRVVPVANIARYDFTPAREIATAFIRRLEHEVDVPILLDLDGTLSEPPWDLPADTSSVILLDRDGTVLWRRSGRLSDDDVRTLLARIAELLEVPPPAP